MIFKFVRQLGSNIEGGIVSSFTNVTIEKGALLEDRRAELLSIGIRQLVKRISDMICSSLLIVIGTPFYILIALGIKLTSPGPVFFRQERVGYKCGSFSIWKFRTMRHEKSEDDHRTYIQYLLNEGPQAENQVDLLTKYIDHVQNKTTLFGRFLRATSLDELPQLFNIWVGEMSLVGPRPHPTYEVDEYKEWYKRRLNVKPGLTGWSKINLRCTPKNYEESILYDLWYVDHWSLVLDLKIFVLTVPFVILMKDAR